MLVAVEDVQALTPHERRHLADGRLPSACLAHQQHRLHALQTPAHHIPKLVETPSGFRPQSTGEDKTAPRALQLLPST